ncbi:hypothetical protein [Streptomyces asiaticus]|uniref:hypothetical protein n=1 Tax=Streptomyces asiaticus TaxID=114695 RepID=UPI00380E7113
MTAELNRSRRYLKPVPRLQLPDEPDVIHLAVYAWEPKFSEWVAYGTALCGRSTEQGDLPMDAEVTCPGCIDYRPSYQAALDRQAAAKTDPSDLGEQPEGDDTTEADRVSKLADQLAGIYDYTRLTELEKDDPQRAQEHRDAAHELLGWMDGAPREERRAAFSRGWERAKERRNELAERRISELEDVLASLRPDARTASATAASWAQARQDPRFELVLREALGLDRYDGEPVIARRSLAELLTARIMAAIRAHEAGSGQ